VRVRDVQRKHNLKTPWTARARPIFSGPDTAM
jgi:hypothetical protein